MDRLATLLADMDVAAACSSTAEMIEARITGGEPPEQAIRACLVTAVSMLRSAEGDRATVAWLKRSASDVERMGRAATRPVSGRR